MDFPVCQNPPNHAQKAVRHACRPPQSVTNPLKKSYCGEGDLLFEMKGRVLSVSNGPDLYAFSRILCAADEMTPLTSRVERF